MPYLKIARLIVCLFVKNKNTLHFPWFWSLKTWNNDAVEQNSAILAWSTSQYNTGFMNNAAGTHQARMTGASWTGPLSIYRANHSGKLQSSRVYCRHSSSPSVPTAPPVTTFCTPDFRVHARLHSAAMPGLNAPWPPKACFLSPPHPETHLRTNLSVTSEVA